MAFFTADVSEIYDFVNQIFKQTPNLDQFWIRSFILSVALLLQYLIMF